MREMSAVGRLTAEDEAETRRLLAMAFETAPVPAGLAGLAATLVPSSPGAAPLPGDLLGQVRKGAVRERRRRVLVPAAAVALSAAVAGGVTAGAVAGRGGPGTPTALQAVTAALVKTSAQSFAYMDTQTVSVQANNAHASSPGAQIGFPSTLHAAGKSDPTNGTGEEEGEVDESQPGNKVKRVPLRSVLVGGYLYAAVPPVYNHGKPWLKMRQPSTTGSALSLELQLEYKLRPPYENPARILGVLKSVSSVREVGAASGPGWTGTEYSFTFTVPTGNPGIPRLMSGTVSVDSVGRVRKLVTVLETRVPPWTTKTTGTATFDDFGVPVSVTAPPASQVYFQK